MDDSRKLKIAVVAPCWFEIPPKAYGGIEWICGWLVEGLIDRGHDVTLIAAGENKTRARFVQSYPEAPSGQLGEPLPEVTHAAAVSELTEGMEFDVFHDHTLAGPLLAAGRQVPTIVTAHGPVAGEIGRYFRRLSKFVQFVAISDSQREDAKDLRWAGRVYNGIPVNEYPFETEKEDYALFLGRMSPEKGADLAIDAARQAGLPIVLAGKRTEPLEQAYFQNAVAPKLGEDTHWIGQVGPVRKKELLAKARCLIFPIRWKEPFGIVMVEALACGTPVVALSGGSVPEIVSDGETGFIFDDPAELGKGMKRAGELDPSACRRRALKLFDIAEMVKGYEDIYRSAI